MLAAIPSSSTTPNDSPCNEGRAQHRRPSQPRVAIGVGESRPSHTTFKAAAIARSSSVCGPTPPTHSTASRSRVRQASSSTSRPLRGSWRPTKNAAGRSVESRNRGSRSGRPRCRSTARRIRRHTSSRARSRAPTPTRRPARTSAPSATATQDASTCGAARPTRGTCRPSGRLKPMSALKHGSGNCRLVEVHEVGLDAAHDLGRSARGRAARARSAPPTRWSSTRRWARPKRHRAPAAVRRRDPTTRTSIAELPQLARQAQHLSLHATRDATANKATSSRPARRHPLDTHSPLPSRSLGQFGCNRCHCSGAARISSSSSCASAWVIRAMSSRNRAVALDLYRSGRTTPR